MLSIALSMTTTSSAMTGVDDSVDTGVDGNDVYGGEEIIKVDDDRHVDANVNVAGGDGVIHEVRNSPAVVLGIS